VLLLLVTIGMLNVCLGFGLAMYNGYGPPGLDGIFQAVGPMPPTTPDAVLPGSGELGAPYVPAPEVPPVPQPIATPVAVAEEATVGPLAEEGVLSDVREMSAAAQTAMLPDAAQARE
jgi:hypothetical protein